MAKSELKRAKDKAWTAFSRYIRMRDCLATTGTTEYGVCISCSTTVEFKNSQAGHLVEGRGSSVLFDEEIVNLQCVGCNIFKRGNYGEYTIAMIHRVGLQKVEEYRSRKRQQVKYTKADYDAICEKYELKYQELGG